MVYEQQENRTYERGDADERDEPVASWSEPASPVTAVIPQLPWQGVSTGRDGLLRRIENVLGSIS
ncbi:hypothetical protein ROA7745_02324 [Roseovarius aestuarii]|uniref:Uncharacterized protein n=1 Tax=Roseovarius aestuarii TaxID=475083 RepID=A0A1X7BSB6_9RHOB|nr:hypothetical protein ROA7745_02324 [Roseovarius aestuarii]